MPRLHCLLILAGRPAQSPSNKLDGVALLRLVEASASWRAWTAAHVSGGNAANVPAGAHGLFVVTQRRRSTVVGTWQDREGQDGETASTRTHVTQTPVVQEEWGHRGRPQKCAVGPAGHKATQGTLQPAAHHRPPAQSLCRGHTHERLRMRKETRPQPAARALRGARAVGVRHAWARLHRSRGLCARAAAACGRAAASGGLAHATVGGPRQE